MDSVRDIKSDDAPPDFADTIPLTLRKGFEMHSILIIDDDEYVLKSLARLLRKNELAISCFHDPHEALIHCATHKFDVVLSDQRMPGIEGTAVFEKIAELQPHSRRILISGYSDFTKVTDAFNAGVIHKFVLKPWNNEQLRRLVAEQIDMDRADKEVIVEPNGLAPEAAAHNTLPGILFHGILTNDSAMLKLISIIRKTRSSDAPVFISGETGTGKELIARAIHLESDRADKPFIAINCANLSASLLESQLFGHRKGAFTGAQKDQRGVLAEVDGGTLLLDEVTELPLELQARLLRVLQEREYVPVGATKPISFDAKIVSASATSLEDAVMSSRFREDLRYRLDVIPIRLPPLRDRRDDCKLLFDYFLNNQMSRHHREMLPIDSAVYSKILAYTWPGNIRELVNVCTYIAALVGKNEKRIALSDLPLVIQQGGRTDGEPDKKLSTDTADIASLPATGRELRRESLIKAIEDYSGHRESIANHFGISRMTLWRRMKEFDLT